MNARDVDLPRIIRHAGDILGFALTAGFVFAACVCWYRYGRHLAIAGVPPFESATLQFLVRDSALPQRAVQWVLAWAWLVAFGGCAVLALAGIRWSVVRAREVLLDPKR